MRFPDILGPKVIMSVFSAFRGLRKLIPLPPFVPLSFFFPEAP